MGLFYYAIPLVFLAGIAFIFFFLIAILLMNKCEVCRSRNLKHNAFCNNCGSNLTIQGNFNETAIFNRLTIFLSFFVPFVGVYLWLYFRKIYPSRSRTLVISAIVGFIFGILNAYFGIIGVYYYLFFGFYFYGF